MDSVSRIPNPIIYYVVGNNVKGATSTPAWASSGGPYSIKLSGGYPATVSANWHVGDDVGGFGGKLYVKSLRFSGQKLPSALSDNLLSKIIELAASNFFEITEVLSFIKREQYFEYLPLIRGVSCR